MSPKKEFPDMFQREDFPMPEYDTVFKELRKGASLERLGELLNAYENKLKNQELLDRERKIEYDKIVDTLRESISKKDPNKLIRVDEKYLRKKFGEKLNDW